LKRLLCNRAIRLFPQSEGFPWATPQKVRCQHGQTAIIRDCLDWTKVCAKDQAGNILLIAMKRIDVDKPAPAAAYSGFRLGGGNAWKNGASDAAQNWRIVVCQCF